jgi:DNA modification methylase
MSMTTDRNTILQADCLTPPPHLLAESVSFILTDPPYNTR